MYIFFLTVGLAENDFQLLIGFYFWSEIFNEGQTCVRGWL